MAEDGGRLQRAAEKAAQEITSADVAVSGGCSPAEALATIVGSGPEDVVGEFVDLNRKHLGDRANSPEIIAYQLDAGSPILRCRVSNSGKVLVPLVDDIVPMVGFPKEKPDLKSSDKEVRKQRNDLAKSDSYFIKLLKPASDIQSSLRYPPSSVPQLAQAIRPDFSFWPLASTVISLGVIGFMKMHYKNKK